MSTVFAKVAVDRELLSVDRHYYNLYVDDKGMRGAFMWNTGRTFRTPFSLISDMMKNNKYKSMSVENTLKDDEKNFYFTFEDVQGIVYDDNHKELQVLTNSELIRLLFRNISKYEEMIKLITAQIPEKSHKKDVDVKLSIEYGYKN